MNMVGDKMKAEEMRSAPTDPATETNMVRLDMAKAGGNEETKSVVMDPTRETNMVRLDMAREPRSVVMDPIRETNIVRLDMPKAEDQINMAGGSPTDPLVVVETSSVLPDMAVGESMVARLLVLNDLTSVVGIATAMASATVTMAAMAATTEKMTLTTSNSIGCTILCKCSL